MKQQWKPNTKKQDQAQRGNISFNSCFSFKKQNKTKQSLLLYS